MNSPILTSDRRRFLRRLTVGAALFTVPGAFAEELVRTPRQTEGPFYPDHLPLDTDNDLIIVNDALTPAVGEITHLSGRILDAKGQPIRNALVEIWQVDNNGVYLHSKDTHAARDKNFQGFGRFLTGSTGEYYFRTIKPVLYPGRTRHIEWVKVKSGQRELNSTIAYPEVKDKATAVIVIHEIFGLSDWVRGVTDQFAEAGYIAIAPDLLSGVAPGGGGTAEIGSRDAVTKAIYSLPADQI